jgi:hypothetical protein
VSVVGDPLVRPRTVVRGGLAQTGIDSPYREHRRRLLNLAAAITLDRSVAEEVVHEASYVNGAAGTFTQMISQNYSTSDPVNAVEMRDRSVVYYGAGFESAAQDLANRIGDAGIAPMPDTSTILETGTYLTAPSSSSATIALQGLPRSSPPPRPADLFLRRRSTRRSSLVHP